MATHLKPGERLIPDDTQSAEDYIQLLRHLFVYEWLKEQIDSGDRIIDLGFGEGYGTKMLSESCREITGLDVADKVVGYASEKYSGDNCKFMKYDGQKIPFSEDTFDVAVSFQVIEHIENDNPFVAELQRVLKKRGTLYMTTPNRATRLKPGQKPFNRFHKREYYSHQLKEVLCKHFEDVNVFGVSATEEIHRIESERIKRGGLLSFAVNLGLRKLIPESMDLTVARFIARLRGQMRLSSDKQNFKQRFSIADFRIEKVDVDESLDLFAICLKK